MSQEMHEHESSPKEHKKKEVDVRRGASFPLLTTGRGLLRQASMASPISNLTSRGGSQYVTR